MSEIRSRLRNFVGSHHKQPAGVIGNMGDAIADILHQLDSHSVLR